MSTLAYYATLARQLGPTDLARVVARRANRVARQALHRRRAGWDGERLLAALGGGDPGTLARRLLAPTRHPAWCEPSQRAGVLTALKAIPGAIEKTLLRADAAERLQFDVFGAEVSFEANPGRVDWHTDPLSGHRYPSIPSEELALIRSGTDPKYPWAIGRGDSWIALAQGYWVGSSAKGSRFAARFVSQVNDFLEANPLGIGVQWACPMEVALRAANLAQALRMFSNAAEVMNPSFALRALASLVEHLEFVEAHLEDQGAVPNNHLVSNYVGLLVGGLLFQELPGAPDKVALGAAGVREQMDLQVHPDGVSFEGSVPYHRLALELFCLAHVTSRSKGVDLGCAFESRLHQMFHVAAAYCSERGLAPQIGDNDSGRVFPFVDRPSLDHGYLASLGAALFVDAELKHEGACLAEEAAWLLGEVGLRRFDRVSAIARPRSFSSPVSGLFVLRGAGAAVTVSAGAHGQRGVGGHNHNDKLSFELHLDGVPVIVDPGTGTYGRDPSLRNQLRSTRAHNTPEVDDRELSGLDPSRLFSMRDTAACSGDRIVEGPAVDRWTGRHHGYAAAGEGGGVVVQRTLALDKQHRALSVCDHFLGAGAHSVLSRLHLPDAQARLREVTEEELGRASRVAGAPACLGPIAVELAGGRATVLVGEGWEVALERSSYSPAYGQLRPALCVTARRSINAPDGMGFVVLFGGSTQCA